MHEQSQRCGRSLERRRTLLVTGVIVIIGAGVIPARRGRLKPTTRSELERDSARESEPDPESHPDSNTEPVNTEPVREHQPIRTAQGAESPDSIPTNGDRPPRSRAVAHEPSRRRP